MAGLLAPKKTLTTQGGTATGGPEKPTTTRLRSPVEPQQMSIAGGAGGGLRPGGGPRPVPRGGSAAPDYSALINAFGQAGGGGTPAQPQPMTNTSSPNPTITDINKTQLERANGDMNVANLSRASDIAIRDNSENERKAARQNAASRGVSGGGIEDIQQGGITRDTLRAQTGARVDLANDAEARRDGLYGQIAGQAATDENLQNQQRALAYNAQWQQQQAQQHQQDSELSRFSKLFDFFGSPLGSPGGFLAE